MINYFVTAFMLAFLHFGAVSLVMLEEIAQQVRRKWLDPFPLGRPVMTGAVFALEYSFIILI